jgi:hypothetical protein
MAIAVGEKTSAPSVDSELWIGQERGKTREPESQHCFRGLESETKGAVCRGSEDGLASVLMQLFAVLLTAGFW